MVELARVLIPIDFSECSARALSVATRLANGSGALLILLHVIERRPARLDLLQHRFAQILPPMPASVAERTHARVLFGDPVERILQTAKGCDCILLGQFGHRRRGLALGRVAAAIRRKAVCAVMIVDAEGRVSESTAAA